MKLDLEISPRRGAGGEAWSLPRPHPAPRGDRQSLVHLQAAVGERAWAWVMPAVPWALGSAALWLLRPASPGHDVGPSTPSWHLAMPGPGLGTRPKQRWTGLTLSAPERTKV